MLELSEKKIAKIFKNHVDYKKQKKKIRVEMMK